MTVTCEPNVLGSMMKRMTLMKPNAALTTSLVRDDSSRQMLCSSCSMVVTSIESEKDKATHWIQSKHQSFEISTSNELKVSRPTFVLKHQARECQHCAGDHGDGACESCVHQHQILLHGIWITDRRLINAKHLQSNLSKEKLVSLKV